MIRTDQECRRNNSGSLCITNPKVTEALTGIDSNYGAVKPTETKMAELVSLAEEIREKPSCPQGELSLNAYEKLP